MLEIRAPSKHRLLYYYKQMFFKCGTFLQLIEKLLIELRNAESIFSLLLTLERQRKGNKTFFTHLILATCKSKCS